MASPDRNGGKKGSGELSPTSSPESTRDHALSQDAAEIKRLRSEVAQLRQLNAQLSGRTQVLKEGSLMRFREKLISSGWRERLYELRVEGPDGVAYLRCFSGPQLRALKMAVQLGPTCEIVREEESIAALNCFQIHVPLGSGPATVIRLGTEDSGQADEWVAALEAACRACDAKADDGAAEMKRAMSPVKEVAARGKGILRATHREQRESLLTSGPEGGGLPECNVHGILNLSVLVLVAMNFRLVVENFLKYGWLLDPLWSLSAVARPENCQCLLCLLCLPAFAALVFAVEWAASQGHLPEPTARAAQGFLCTLSVAVPIEVIRRSAEASPAVGGVLLLNAMVVFMKLVSYSHTNVQLRRIWRDKRAAAKADEISIVGLIASVGPTTVEYPENVTAMNLLRFLTYPTLVYQTSYPLSRRVRKSWLAKRFCELAVLLAAMVIITEQFIAPTVRNSSVPLRELNAPKLLERLLKLAVPNCYLWLCIFYTLFHLWLNILAEVTCFGDRLFYKEWWNATRLEEYWRLWNLPVHNWLLRHLFFPCLNMGMPKAAAVLVVFFVSAVMHEVLVSVPCHTVRLWAFFGMMAQLPLVWLTGFIDRHLQGNRIGNFIFWISFCIVGQPLCILLYYADFIGP